MQCYVCKGTDLLKILNKNSIRVWNGGGDIGDNALPSSKFRCILVQCRICGHIQQPVSATLKRFLSLLYQSPYASVSTEIGIGSWGGRRGQSVLNFLSNFYSSQPQSVLEIGCARGYLLRYLLKIGFKDLTGIDPSIKKNHTKNGIQYRNDFVNARLQLGRKFDLIISLCGFEHIKDIDDILVFIHHHLSDRGVLFFEVPYSMPQLKFGDPALFLHEHIHHFSESSLDILLTRNGFKDIKIKSIGDSFFVFAKKDSMSEIVGYPVVLYENYQYLLDCNIARIVSIIHSKKRIAFHGACNALHNFFYWGNIKSNFSLFDNDQVKIGKRYFNKEVLSPTQARVNQYDCVIVMPSIYGKEIIAQYRSLGFNGQIEAVIPYSN